MWQCPRCDYKLRKQVVTSIGDVLPNPLVELDQCPNDGEALVPDDGLSSER